MSRRLWERTPDFSKLPLSFLYHTLKSPLDFNRNRNLSKYDVSVGRKAEIHYIPPVFDAFITSKCNLRCPTCLFRLKDDKAFNDGGFMRLWDFHTVINRYSSFLTTVWLSGGEPLLHPDFDAIVRTVKNSKLPVMLSTNGLLIEERLKTLKFVDFLNVSLDGYDYESFKRLRGGTEHQFDAIVRGLSLLTRNGIKFTVTFMLSEESLLDIYNMLGFAVQISPSCVYFHNINPHGSKEYKSLTKTPPVMQVMQDITGETHPFNVVLPVIYDTTSLHFKTAKCTQPWGTCYFDDKGDIAYCCHLRHSSSIGNIFGDYDFNSRPLVSFRKRMISHDYPEDCIYCERRFAGMEL